MEENKNENPQITQQLRTLQIIVVALAMGCLTFAVFVIYSNQGKQPIGNTISILAAAVAVVMGLLKTILPNTISSIQNTNRSRRQKESESESSPNGAMAKFTTKTIVACAFLEGAAFFNVIAYMLEGNLWSIGIAGVLIAFMLMEFPSENRFQRWEEKLKNKDNF